MRVAVSGSSGFIGSALVHELRAKGHEVHPIVRHLARAGEIGLNLEDRTLDCTQLPEGTLSGIDLVYHLAGEPLTPRRWTPAKREAIRASRTISTDIIARALATTNNPPPNLVTMSAIGYYGARGDELLNETSASGTGFVAEVCRAWEAASAPAKAVGIRVVHARTGIVLGRRGGLLKQLMPLYQFGLGARLGDGQQWMSHIALADEIKALLFVGTHDNIVGPCNLASPIPTTNAAFTTALGHELHRPTLLRIPTLALRLALGKTAANEMALVSRRVAPKRLLEEGFSFDYPHITDALSAS